VRAARGPPSRGQPGWLAVHSRPPLSGRQVLLFRASARDELTPPLHRAPPGQHAGRPLAEGTHPRAFVPEALYPSGFDAIVPPIDASAVVHTRSSSRRPPDPLTAGLSPQRSPPRLLTGAACGGLGSPPARRTRRTYLHHWHSTVRAGDLLHRLTPLSGRTTERRIRARPWMGAHYATRREPSRLRAPIAHHVNTGKPRRKHYPHSPCRFWPIRCGPACRRRDSAISP